MYIRIYIYIPRASKTLNKKNLATNFRLLDDLDALCNYGPPWQCSRHGRAAPTRDRAGRFATRSRRRCATAARHLKGCRSSGHGKTIRKPWENHRKTIGKPEKMGFSMGFIVLSWQLTQFTCFTGGPHPVVRSWTLGSPMKHICFTPIPLVLWPFFMGTLSVLVHLYIVYIYIVLYYYIYMLSMRVAACTCTSMDQSAKSSILKRHRNANV